MAKLDYHRNYDEPRDKVLPGFRISKKEQSLLDRMSARYNTNRYYKVSRTDILFKALEVFEQLELAKDGNDKTNGND